MDLEWIQETPPRWDAEKARILGGAPAGTLDTAKLAAGIGERLPGDWWRVESGGRALGYGWMDTSWGDAEILLVVEPESQRRGVGSFILDHLEREAKGRGLNYLYNAVPPGHPDPAGITAWLGKRGFTPSADGMLLRGVVRPRPGG